MQAGARSRTGGGTGFRAINDGNASTNCGGIAAIRRSSTEGDLYFRRVGCGLAAGDLNGNGITDLLVGAPGVSSPAHPAAGAVYVFAGSRGTSPHRIDLASGEQLTAYVELGGVWTGFGLALGGTRFVRRCMGTDEAVAYGSGYYWVGWGSGQVWWVLLLHSMVPTPPGEAPPAERPTTPSPLPTTPTGQSAELLSGSITATATTTTMIRSGGWLRSPDSSPATSWIRARPTTSATATTARASR